ncbi:hypothetical protein [Psychrobacter lutiphocae]|uniref:hypothetical protein n=1 Tax=Psychrobacter lutiphocae TaxID=540500 RepID=UPI00036C79E5|nr:hypothetical protein [Psychrobacter lutiphocae]
MANHIDIDELVLREEAVRERYFHDLIISNNNIKSDLLSILDLPTSLDALNLIHEDRYLNGIIADFTLVYDNQIEAIIEVKAADIGLTSYVRGIGQVLQYEYFWEKGITSNRTPSDSSYSSEFKSVLFIPSSIFQNKLFNVGLFKYPDTTKIIEVNEVNNAVREVSKKELKALEDAKVNNITSISQYYVRDNRLFEIYMLLKYLCYLSYKVNKEVKLNRYEIEEKMRETDSINNRNWRNAFISLSSFGFIDSNNMPTKKGMEYGSLKVSEFLFEMYKSYVNPYIDKLMSYFDSNHLNLNKSLADIKQDYLDLYNGREILYFTQSDTRYLSSWLNILRDDFGCIDFDPRSTERTFNYNPTSLRDAYLLRKIEMHTKAHNYVTRLGKLLS